MEKKIVKPVTRRIESSVKQARGFIWPVSEFGVSFRLGDYIRGVIWTLGRISHPLVAAHPPPSSPPAGAASSSSSSSSASLLMLPPPPSFHLAPSCCLSSLKIQSPPASAPAKGEGNVALPEASLMVEKAHEVWRRLAASRG